MVSNVRNEVVLVGSVIRKQVLVINGEVIGAVVEMFVKTDDYERYPKIVFPKGLAEEVALCEKGDVIAVNGTIQVANTGSGNLLSVVAKSFEKDKFHQFHYANNYVLSARVEAIKTSEHITNFKLSFLDSDGMGEFVGYKSVFGNLKNIKEGDIVTVYGDVVTRRKERANENTKVKVFQNYSIRKIEAVR